MQRSWRLLSLGVLVHVHDVQGTNNAYVATPSYHGHILTLTHQTSATDQRASTSHAVDVWR